MFELAAEPTQLSISMSPGLEEIDEACEETGMFVERLGLQQYAFDILLVTREALVNAVIHGCSGDRQKTVKYCIRRDGDCLVMEVEDEGEGFDWHARLGREAEITSECGRGLMIMSRYATEMSFNATGNRLVLKKLVVGRVGDL